MLLFSNLFSFSNLGMKAYFEEQKTVLLHIYQVTHSPKRCYIFRSLHKTSIDIKILSNQKAHEVLDGQCVVSCNCALAGLAHSLHL